MLICPKMREAEEKNPQITGTRGKVHSTRAYTYSPFQIYARAHFFIGLVIFATFHTAGGREG